MAVALREDLIKTFPVLSVGVSELITAKVGRQGHLGKILGIYPNHITDVHYEAFVRNLYK